METKQKSLVPFFILVVVIVLIVSGCIIAFSRRGVISPVPDEGAIRIIYLSPSPTGTASSPTVTPPSK